MNYDLRARITFLLKKRNQKQTVDTCGLRSAIYPPTFNLIQSTGSLRRESYRIRDCLRIDLGRLKPMCEWHLLQWQCAIQSSSPSLCINMSLVIKWHPNCYFPHRTNLFSIHLCIISYMYVYLSFTMTYLVARIPSSTPCTISHASTTELQRLSLVLFHV